MSSIDPIRNKGIDSCDIHFLFRGVMCVLAVLERFDVSAIVVDPDSTDSQTPDNNKTRTRNTAIITIDLDPSLSLSCARYDFICSFGSAATISSSRYECCTREDRSPRSNDEHSRGLIFFLWWS